MRIDFGHPWFLLLLAVIPAVWMALRYSLRDFERKQQIMMATSRTLILVLLILAVSQVRWNYSSDRTTHVFLVDVSGSMGPGEIGRAHDFVNQAWKSRNEDVMHVVVFADTPRELEFSPTARNVPDFIAATGSAALGTDLAAAIRLGLSLMPDDAAKQITILSDGNETKEEALAEIAHARTVGAKIFAIPMGRKLDVETAIAGVNIPARTNVNESFNTSVTITATQATLAELNVLRDGELISNTPLKLQPGDNNVTVKAQAIKSGICDFEYQLKADKDTIAENNNARVSTIAEGKPRVLYVEGKTDSSRFLLDALKHEQIDVDLHNTLPRDLATFGQYDLVVVSDTKASALGTSQMAMMETYVNDLGGGVLLAGGDNSFGIGGFNDTPVERLSPVSFQPEKKQLPSLALILVMDKSGSMAGRKIEMAKDASVAAVNALDDEDLVGVLEFDHTWEWLAQPRQAKERVQLREQISGMQASGGTNIYAALEESYNMLAKTQARTKHVILMTDGRSQAGDYQALVEKMAKEKMTVTAVAIGSGADRELLDNIAKWGNGRSYFTENAEELPQIFVKEAKHEPQPQTLIEKPFRPIVQKTGEVISGIDFNSAPTLLGYNETKPKPTSEILLVSPKGDPILARWRYGLGKVAAFTSDVKNRWAVNWITWGGYTKFWSQLARDTMRRRSADGLNLNLVERNQQAFLTLDLTDAGEVPTGQITATVIGPGNIKEELGLRQTQVGVFTGSIPLNKSGDYVVTITRTLPNGVTSTASAAVTRSQSTEYARTAPNQALLARLTGETGGKLNPTTAELFRPSGERIYALREIWRTLLWLVLPLFLADLFLRRVRLFEPR